ncbi:hypothetical protein ACFXB3_25015 [Streptomyces sp. NPDC059447]|uniref:hypothetical protein n=1 Tax=Streptomyces sp. NPDC059447 TaxID=3346834 RepID=UPI0036B8B36D
MSHPYDQPQQPGPVPPQWGPQPPQQRRPLSRAQRVGLSGCAIVVGGFVALVTAALAFGPDQVVKEKRVPGPTVTVTAAGPTVTVTASPALPPPGIPQLTGGTWKDAQARTVTLEAKSAHSDVTLPADAAAYAGWKVCGQDGGLVEGAPAKITLYLGESSCPAKIGDRLTPEPSPTPPPAPAAQPRPDDKGSTGGSGSGSGGTSSSSDSGGSTGSSGSSSSGGSGGGGSSSRIVHPGSFCSPAGATGVTSAGTPMVCGPGSDGRNRWHKA